jgi:opine dehydrogenase
VARWAGVDAPLTQGLLAIAGGWQGRDLRAGARTLEGLGLAPGVAMQLETGRPDPNRRLDAHIA